MQLAEYARQMRAEEVERLGSQRLNYLYKRNCAITGPRLHCKREVDGTVELYALPCKSWSCETCSRLLRGRLIEAVRQAIGQHGLDLFMTFTLRKQGNGDTRGEVKQISNAWRSFTRQFKREYGQSLVYLRFLEIKDGWPHYHVLTKGLPHRWAKDTWCHYTGAFEVDSEPIGDVSGVADYATKFVHYNARRYGKIVKRWYGASAGVDLKIRDNVAGEDAGWKVVRGALTEAFCRFEGAEVVAWDQAGRPKRAIVKTTESKITSGTGDTIMPCPAEQSGAGHPHERVCPGAGATGETGRREGGAYVSGV